MVNNRIDDHPILGMLDNQPAVAFTFDGIQYGGVAGDTIASALLARGVRTLRVHEESGNPRGLYCNIGHCYECRVTVDQVSGVRACLTEITESMIVESGKKQPAPFKKVQSTGQLPRSYADFQGIVEYKKEAQPDD